MEKSNSIAAGTIETTPTGTRRKYNGNKWDTLCDFEKFDSIVHKDGLCQLHYKPSTNVIPSMNSRVIGHIYVDAFGVKRKWIGQFFQRVCSVNDCKTTSDKLAICKLHFIQQTKGNPTTSLVSGY